MKVKTFFKTMAKMIRKHCPRARQWNYKDLVNWIAWFAENRRMCLIMEGSQIIGVGMWRYLKNLEQHRDWGHHDENGSILWFDYAYSVKFPVLLRIWRHASKKENLKQLAYLRVKKNDELCILNLNHRGS